MTVMTDRKAKLEELKKRSPIKKTPITESEQAFIKTLQDATEELKNSLGVGVAVNNLDDLVEQLGKIESFEKEVGALKDSISAIKFPDEVNIKGIDSLTSAVEKLSKLPKPVVQKIDFSVLDSVVEGVLALIDKVEELQVPKQGQLPDDYVPMRRVQKVGNKLLFDDSFYGGGGGGAAAIPNVGGSVPVVNPDGTYVNAATNYATRLDDFTTTNVTYIGKSVIGSAVGSAVWQIQKIDETTGMVITWADGNSNFDNVWGASGAVAGLTFS